MSDQPLSISPLPSLPPPSILHTRNHSPWISSTPLQYLHKLNTLGLTHEICSINPLSYLCDAQKPRTKNDLFALIFAYLASVDIGDSVKGKRRRVVWRREVRRLMSCAKGEVLRELQLEIRDRKGGEDKEGQNTKGELNENWYSKVELIWMILERKFKMSDFGPERAYADASSTLTQSQRQSRSKSTIEIGIPHVNARDTDRI